MPVTIREYLGDEKIAQLEGMGFLPNLIADMAKRQYMSDKQAKRKELSDAGLDGKLVQSIIRGDVSEEEARNAQKFEDFGAKKHGWGLGAAKTVAGIANAAERVSDFVNPFYEGKRDERGNYIYQNAFEKSLRPKIKSAEKLRDDYEKATGETSWGSRAAEIGTEMVADPINFVGGLGLLSKGSKLAQFGKKTLYFAGTGAASGGVMALGEGRNDEETLKNMGYGVVGGFVLGHTIDQSIQGISKLIAKRRASRAPNEADAVSEAENSEFIDGDGGAGAGGIKAAEVNFDGPDDQTMATIVVRDTLKKESLAVREKVLEEIARGAEKSSVISLEKYNNILNGINEYKTYYDILKHARDNPNEVKNAELIFNQMQENFAKANNDNVKKYYDAAAAFGKKSNIAEMMTVREFATSEAGLDEATAAKVVKEAARGKEKSDFVDADTYADIVKFKNFENQRDYAKAYGEQIEAAKQSLNNAREQSAVRYAETQKAINEYQRQGMPAGAVRELVNTNFKPSADEINYTRAYNDGADVDPRLAGQGIFYALEKDIAAYKYTPEQYFARLESKGCGDESAQVFTQAYVQKDINIAKDWANAKVAEKYEAQIREEAANEIKVKNEIDGTGWTMKDGGAAKQYARHKFEVEKWINDLGGVLSDEWAANLKSLALKHPEMFKSEADVFRVIKEIKENPTHFFKNNRDDAALIAKELKDGKAGNIVIKKDDGEIVHVNKTRKGDLARLQRNNEKALEGTPTPSILDAGITPAQTRRFAATPNDEIIPQKGNLVNEKANGLSDSVSRIGDNASRASGRQGSDEQILRQGRRDTSNASQTKRPAQGDKPVEQRLAAKADGANDASAAGEQVVEKQGGGAGIGGGLRANSNAHLGSGLVAGTLNSVDEDGNFSPERFAAGFLAGLAGSKAASVALKKVAPKLYENLTNTAKSFSDKGIKEIRSEIEKLNGITPIKEFGENYAEFYHNGKGAIQKLLKEKKGQVAGAFYREDIGDVTLPWGEVFRKGEKIKGYGVAKIIEKHGKEILNKLPKIFETGNLIKQNDVHYRIESGNYVVGLSSEFKGEKHNFVLTAFERNERKTDIFTDPSFRAASDDLATNSDKGIIPQNPNDAASNLPKPEDIIAKHPNVERELDESIAAMRKESFNDSNFKAELMGKFDTKEITTQELGKSVNLSDKQLAVLKNDIKNADFKVISDSKIYFDKMGKDGDKKRFFVDIAEDGSLRVDAYAKSQIDNIPVKQSALEELAGAGDSARLKNMSFEVKAAYRNELDPIKKEAILKIAELNKLKKAAQGGDKAAVAKFEEFKAKNLDEDGNIKDGLELC